MNFLKQIYIFPVFEGTKTLNFALDPITLSTTQATHACKNY